MKGRALGDLLAESESLLARSPIAYGQITTNAHDEALALLLPTLGLPLDAGPQVLSRIVTPAQRARVQDLLLRRIEDHIPVPYLTGEAWLGGLRFEVDPRVIIPRSYFVEILSEPARLGKLPPRPDMADVCTGSGCLAVLLARQFSGSRVDAIEIDEGALEVARRNVAAHRLTRRLHLWLSDVFEAVPPRRYDLILSNPPYEPTARVRALPPEFQREPARALDGGVDGMDIIRRLIAQSAARLKPAGSLLIEVGGLRRRIEKEFGHLRPEWLPTADGSNCICRFRSTAARQRG